MELSPLLLEKTVRAALEEDLGHGHDITSKAVVAPGTQARAVLMARKSGVLAGTGPAILAFALCMPDAVIDFEVQDGARLKAGQVIATITGEASGILAAERVALNFLIHLSGIATLTHQYVEAVRKTNAKICDTRKTLAGLRALQKYAVRMGGGTNHRFGLDDAILIKDNHIAVAGGIENALRLAQQNSGHMVRVEIEVDTLAQLDEVLAFQKQHSGVDVVMFDNFALPDLKKAVKTVNRVLVTEASGGVSLDTVKAIAETGVDYISAGALTHSAPALDIGLDFEAL
ncbi:MAG: carboxylating nicotinate-nucleotide diphosphorylase [Alphaproteobacteria bacterium]|nr:carboxylating nicotinate-nucleotide diphosphorylase [Alphaproteobacteria bacterium]MBP7759044.1 carboxylating nicotinate-nucleotide diphosphorylase [Alphaproteobacteria bacterium]MBP7762318.1 carboxylating nicotinate-nucleotide diphosphorylase [Alphaproteobacteria bacterium]MBP7905528.1 carboxylating nicotinate-nucleotide diphosphorylase [Alphaproteobacteria bacterium]